jgi:hypothetical protein
VQVLLACASAVVDKGITLEPLAFLFYALQVNLKVFGHSSFRPQQKQIVQQAVQGKDLFVLMPTGGGKSLCYQVLGGWVTDRSWTLYMYHWLTGTPRL